MSFRAILFVIVCVIAAMSITYGAYLFFPGLGYIVLGICLVTIAYIALGEDASS